jgi:hypothetical protein
MIIAGILCLAVSAFIFIFLSKRPTVSEDGAGF